MILIELEGLQDFFRARTVLIFFLKGVILLHSSFVFISRGILEEIKVKVLVFQDAFIQRFLLVQVTKHSGHSCCSIERIHLGCESLNCESGLRIRELLDKWVLPLC